MAGGAEGTGGNGALDTLVELKAPGTPEGFEAYKAETLGRAGIAGIRPLGRMLFVRTRPLEQKTRSGLIWLPPSASKFHGGPIHLQLAAGVVIAAGPRARKARPGDCVVFQKLVFAWWKRMPDDTLFGWVDEAQVFGLADPDTHLE